MGHLTSVAVPARSMCRYRPDVYPLQLSNAIPSRGSASDCALPAGMYSVAGFNLLVEWRRWTFIARSLAGQGASSYQRGPAQGG